MSSALETILSIHTCSSPVHWTWNPDKIWQTRLYFRVQSVRRRIQSHHWPWTHQCTGHLWWRWWFLGPGHKLLKTKITCALPSICILPPYFRHGTHQRRQIRSWSSGFPAMAGSSKVYVKPCQAMRWSSGLAAHFAELPLAPVDICLRRENRRDARRVSSFQRFQLPYPLVN